MERKQALTFEAEVKDGVLVLPEEYRDAVQGRVSVILLLDRIGSPQSLIEEEDEEDFLEHFWKNPIDAPDFRPLTRDEIYDRDK